MTLEEIKEAIGIKPYYETANGVLYNCDCMEVMQKMPDKCVDLCLTDPPYGLEWKCDNVFNNNSIGVCCTEKHETNKWDKVPDKKVFDMLRAKSKEQIIWGGNYFAGFLGSLKNPIIWDKKTGNNTFADGEMAWTSFKTGTLRIIKHQWCGAFKDSERGIRNVHPTQKPIAIMAWCLNRYSKDDSLILDVFIGSGTTAIACEQLDRKWVGVELSEKYCAIAKERIQNEIRQPKLFSVTDDSVRPVCQPEIL